MPTTASESAQVALSLATVERIPLRSTACFSTVATETDAGRQSDSVKNAAQQHPRYGVRSDSLHGRQFAIRGRRLEGPIDGISKRWSTIPRILLPNFAIMERERLRSSELRRCSATETLSANRRKLVGPAKQCVSQTLTERDALRADVRPSVSISLELKRTLGRTSTRRPDVGHLRESPEPTI